MVPMVLMLGAVAVAADEPVEEADIVEPDRPTYPVLFEGQCDPGDPHFDLEEMYYNGDFFDGLEVTAARLQEYPEDVVLLWMKVRFLFEIGEKFERDDDTIDKVAHYKNMLATAEDGLELKPGEPHLLFGRGIARGRLGTTRGVLSSLFMAKDIERDWLAVAEHPTFRYSSLGGIEVLPCDAYHSLGIFYRLVPDWWIVKVLAGTRGDLDKSEAFHTKAIECKPGAIKNWKELAATQMCLYDKRKDNSKLTAAKESIRRGLALPATDAKARTDHRHLKMLRDDPSTGCEYSRDGQQDLSKDKMD